MQASPAAAYAASFREYPTWLHTDPVQIIGLPAQVDPAFLPNRATIDRACSEFGSKWHPDRYRRNGFSNTEDAMAIYMRGHDACELLFQTLDNPSCEWLRNNITNFDEAMGYNKRVLPAFAKQYPHTAQGFPHFQEGCACAWSRYRREWWYKMVVPVDLQPDPPATLEETCPCTLGMALSSWSSFSFNDSGIPPPPIFRVSSLVSRSLPPTRGFCGFT